MKQSYKSRFEPYKYGAAYRPSRPYNGNTVGNYVPAYTAAAYQPVRRLLHNLLLQSTHQLRSRLLSRTAVSPASSSSAIVAATFSTADPSSSCNISIQVFVFVQFLCLFSFCVCSVFVLCTLTPTTNYT